jgi:hypothetical protein
MGSRCYFGEGLNENNSRAGSGNSISGEGVSDGDGEILIVIRYQVMDLLRNDPRFVDLMKKLGLPQ